MDKFLGVRYPLVKDPRGYFSPQGGTKQIKSDLLSLLLTNKNERVMETDFGVGLNELLFEQPIGIEEVARNKIISAIETYDPRITVEEITITTDPDEADLSPFDDGTQEGHILYIRIKFVDPENINAVQELRLDIPLSDSTGDRTRR